MDKPEKRTICARLSERQIERLEHIMAEEGVTNYSAGITMAISKGYEKLFPKTVRHKPNLYGGNSALTPEQKAKQHHEYQQAKKKAERDAEDAKYEKVCVQDLEGEVKEYHGEKFCEYTTHMFQGDFFQRRPLHQIDSDIPIWIPSKEQVAERRPEVIKKYGLKLPKKKS